MGDINSDSKISIDYSGGNFQLLKVKSFDVTSEKEKTVVTAVGVKGGAGYRKKQGGGEITLEVYRETGTPEVNYYDLENTGELFKVVIQDGDGEPAPREQYRGVTVKNCSRKGDDAGNSMMTVKLGYLRGPIQLA